LYSLNIKVCSTSIWVQAKIYKYLGLYENWISRRWFDSYSASSPIPARIVLYRGKKIKKPKKKRFTVSSVFSFYFLSQRGICISIWPCIILILLQTGSFVVRPPHPQLEDARATGIDLGWWFWKELDSGVLEDATTDSITRPRAYI
jgi:hypothetical protein